MFERSLDLENWEAVPKQKVEYAIKWVFGEGGVCFGMQMIAEGTAFSAGDYHYRKLGQGEESEREFQSIGDVLSKLGLELDVERGCFFCIFTESARETLAAVGWALHQKEATAVPSVNWSEGVLGAGGGNAVQSKI